LLSSSAAFFCARRNHATSAQAKKKGLSPEGNRPQAASSGSD